MPTTCATRTASGSRAPRGWEVLRLAHDDLHGPSSDDLLALADAVREAAQPRPVEVPLPPGGPPEGARRGHLRAVPSGGLIPRRLGRVGP